MKKSLKILQILDYYISDMSDKKGFIIMGNP